MKKDVGRTKVCRFFLLAAILVITAGAEARAQGTLEGETLISEPFNFGFRCGEITGEPANSGFININTSGVAAGPYPGTFLEQGRTEFSGGVITSFNTTFTINTPTGEQITGTKELLREGSGSITCTGNFTNPVTLTIIATGLLKYTANINGFEDTGEAMFDIEVVFVNGQVVARRFTEVFYLSNSVITTLGKVTGGGSILHFGGPTGVTFGFVAKNTEQGMQGGGVVIDHATNTRIKILDVTNLAVVGTHAYFTGRAEVNGVEEDYRIDVDDLGEPGTPGDTFKIQTDSYVNMGPLTGGNIQIHKKPVPTL